MRWQAALTCTHVPGLARTVSPPSSLAAAHTGALGFSGGGRGDGVPPGVVERDLPRSFSRPRGDRCEFHGRGRAERRGGVQGSAVRSRLRPLRDPLLAMRDTGETGSQPNQADPVCYGTKHPKCPYTVCKYSKSLIGFERV